MNDGYQEAVQRLTLLQSRDHDAVGPAGRTIALLQGRRTERVALLLHGLTACPSQFAAIAHTLHESGMNVIVPRLPRHGYADRMTDVLAGLQPRELTQRVERSYEIACGLGEQVTVCGFSLGGLLTSWLAQREPVDVAIPIAPFLGVALLPNRLMPTLAWAALALPNFFAWWNPLKRERQMPEHGYPRYATHALARVYEVAQELFVDAMRQPPKAKRILMVTNARESSVNNRAARKLVEAWRSRRDEGVEIFSITGLPISHDIIEPHREPSLAARVYPILYDLMGVHPQRTA